MSTVDPALATETSKTRTYQVALSYAREDIAYVERVANALIARQIRCFWDHTAEAALFASNLLTRLREIFSRDTDFVVIFISKPYTEKPWTKEERAAAQAGSLGNEDYIIYGRLDDSELPGLLKTTHVADLRKKTPEEFADLIAARITKQEPPPPPPPPPKPVPRTRLWPVVAVCLLVAVIALGWAIASKQSRGTVPHVEQPTNVRQSMAVISIHDKSGRSEARYGNAIREYLTQQLGGDGIVRVVSGRDVAAMKADLNLRESETYTSDSLATMAQRLNVQWVIYGSYELPTAGKELVALDLAMFDVSSRVLLRSSDSGAEIPNLVRGRADDLRVKARLRPLSSEGIVAARAALPMSRAAVEPYTEGLAQLFRMNAVEARNLFTRATELEDTFPLAHAELSAAYLALGEDRNAQESAERAFLRTKDLPPEQKLQVNARFYEVKRNWPKAIAAWRSLRDDFPDNLDYALSLVTAHIKGGDIDAALAVVAELRRLPAVLSGDARVDLAEARARQEKSQWGMQIALARSAARKAAAIRARSVVAEAKLLESWALYRHHGMNAMSATVAEARRIFEEIGDKRGVARALELHAVALKMDNNSVAELQLLDRALATYRELEHRGGIARVLVNTATVLVSQGRYAQAQQRYMEALRIFGELRATSDQAGTLNQIGALHFERGELVAAKENYEKALRLYENLGDPGGEAFAATNIGEVLQCLGELDEAGRMHSKSLALNTGRDDSGRAYDLLRLGDIDAARGRRAVARDRYTKAIGLQKDLNEPAALAETRLSLARLELDEEKAAVAEQHAREAGEILRAGGNKDRSVRALALLAESLLAQGKNDEARKTAEQAQREAAGLTNLQTRFAVEITAARVRASRHQQPDRDAALRSLNGLITEAKTRSFVLGEFEARLAAGEIEVRAGLASGTTRLAKLEIDTRERYERVANLAHRAQIKG